MDGRTECQRSRTTAAPQSQFRRAVCSGRRQSSTSSCLLPDVRQPKASSRKKQSEKGRRCAAVGVELQLTRAPASAMHSTVTRLLLQHAVLLTSSPSYSSFTRQLRRRHDNRCVPRLFSYLLSGPDLRPGGSERKVAKRTSC